MTKSKHNDAERRQWVDNDEGLYNMARRYKGGIRKFIRENREMIDGVIDNVVSGKKPAHYLEYGSTGANHRAARSGCSPEGLRGNRENDDHRDGSDRR